MGVLIVTGEGGAEIIASVNKVDAVDDDDDDDDNKSRTMECVHLNKFPST